MARIQRLSDTTILKIAAGEVIERPACVLKELLDNAIDAGATNINVRIERGGIDLIRVQDNGMGIPADELPLAVAPHATSKLRNEADLFNITSQGFRGEALASIGAIANVTIISKIAEASHASALSVEGGNHGTVRPHSGTTGTTVIVQDLFFNTPARRKFVKSTTAEKAHIERVFKRVAMMQPLIRMQLTADDSMLFDLSPSPDVGDRLSQLYANHIFSTLVPFNHQFNQVTCDGFISDRRYQLRTAAECWLFVNHRPVSDRTILSAVKEGYRHALMERRYPLAIIFLKIPTTDVDINIHPRKAEVRFAQAQDVFKAVSQGIHQALRQQLNVSSLPSSINPWAQAMGTSKQEQPIPTTAHYPLAARQTPLFANANEHTMNAYAQTSAPTLDSVPYFTQTEYLFSLDSTYLICRRGQHLVILDQHAAHERVLFERFQKQHLEHSSQQLLEPVTIHMSQGHIELILQHQVQLRSLGFEIEDFGGQAILLRAVPITLKNQAPEAYFHDICQPLLDYLQMPNATSHLDDLLSMMACKAAVKAHDTLTREEIVDLLKQLDQLDLATYCPHGRPTLLEWTLQDLHRLFQRT